jgi:uncharacterized protein YjbI with pentapeptide repeats
MDPGWRRGIGPAPAESTVRAPRTVLLQEAAVQPFRETLSGCDLSGTTFTNASLRNTDLTGARLTGADLTGTVTIDVAHGAGP